MNTVKWLVAVGLTFTFFSITSQGQVFTIDGTLDPGYGSAVATQALGVSTGVAGPKNYLGTVNQSAGSELDAAYAVVSNGVLYLFLAGNLDSGFLGCTNGCAANDKLNVFFMADSGAGGDNTLGTNYNTAADSGGINRMGVLGNGHDPSGAGLTFDAGFNANYWISVTINPTNLGNTASMSANYEVICSHCDGYFLGKDVPPGSVLIPSGAAKNPYGIQIALNNSNTNGVQGDINGCESSGLPYGPQFVTNGVEMAIPLGALGSPLSSISICAFVTDSGYDKLYNQSLGPVWDGTTDGSYCEFEFATDSSEVNFQSLPPSTTGGHHYFTVTVPPCTSIQASPASAAFPVGPGASNEAVTVSSGGCSWTASASTNWITITGGASGSGNGSFTYSVSTNTSINPRTGNLIISIGQVATQIVSVTQEGTVLAPLGALFGNGTLNPGYGCPLAVQQLATSYGPNSNTVSLLAATGSQLDAAYGLVVNNTLFLFLAGNLQDNGNRVHVFFMTAPGGLNTLTNVEPNSVDTSAGRSVLNWMGPTNSVPNVSGPGPGLTFDPGFAPNYWMDMSCNTTQVLFSYAQLWPGGTNAAGVATNGYFLGSNPGGEGTLVGGSTNNPFGVANPFGIQATVNNEGTNGVDASVHNGCYTNSQGVAGGEITQALMMTNGIEMAIPLAALGSPTGTIAVCAFIANNGAGLQMSNQILGPFGTNDPSYCNTGPGRSTNTWMPFLNLGTFPGQHYFYVGPEMRVTSVQVDKTNNVNVSFLTENNTNLTYQLQRTKVLSTNATWSPVGVFQYGNGGIITITDPSGGTNKPGAFYRIRQAPNCLP